MGKGLLAALLIAIGCLAAGQQLAAQAARQVEVKGRVYDITQRNFLEGVSVMATNGRGTSTDTLGYYSLWVGENDSIYFSYQNRITAKYPVMGMQDVRQFNMALHVYSNQLPPVTIFGRSYRMDSLQNRRDYGKYFAYEKPNPLRSINMGNGGAGMDPNDIINLFRFRRNRQLAELRDRLIQEEQDKYVDSRYTPAFVKKVTGLSGDPLKVFMRRNRPPYDFVAIVNELELGYYIQQCYFKERGMLPRGVEVYLLGVEGLENENKRIKN